MSVFEKYDSKKGFTLIEILISLAIAGIVMAAAYSLYITFYKQTSAQDLLVEAQQNARAGIELMQKELVLVGHRVPSTVMVAGIPTTLNAIETAASNSIEFRYVDPDVTSSTFNQNLEITYRVDLVDGVYSLRRRKCVQNASWTVDCSIVDFNRVVDNLNSATALSFSYYDAEGGTPATNADIRFAKVSLTTVTKTALPTTGTTRTVEVRTEVRLRNLGILSSAADTTEPVQPVGLQVREVSVGSRVGFCGRLRLKWTKGTDVDLAGYRIFYSTGSGETLMGWSATVSLGSLESDATSYYYTLAPTTAAGSGGLDFCPSIGTPVITYTFSIRAYDNHSNFSTASGSVSSNPSPSNGNFSGGEDDTTINPSKPAPVTSFTAQDGPTDGQVRLTWSYNTANNPDVTGFRIYRSTEPFTTFPITPGGNITQRTAEPGQGFTADRTLNSTAVTFTDSDVNLAGCQVYYYAIAPVTCDTTLISDEGGDPATKKYIESDYAITWGDGAGSEADSPAGSDTAPPDSGSPSAPTVSGRAGWRRVAITFTNPTSGDFSKSCLYVEKEGTAGSPTLSSEKDANGCFTVVNYDPAVRRLVPDALPDSNPNGVFTNTNPTTFWHDSMTVRNPVEPTLATTENEVQTYAYRAVAFDKCGNPRTLADAISATATAVTNLCGEDPVGKPPAPGLPASSKSGCISAMVLWTPVSSDINQASGTNNPWDLAGYRIFRSDTEDFSSATLLNPLAPYWCEGTCSYPDSSVSEGSTYYYKVASTDCPYEMTTPSEDTVRSNMNSGLINSTATIGPITPGKIGRDEKCPGGGSCVKDLYREVLSGVTIDATNNSAPSTTFTHNTVTLFIDNNSAGNMSIQGVSVRWVNSSAYLRNIRIGGGRTGLPVISNDLPQSATSDVIDDPYTKRVSDYDFTTDVTITGLKRYVPITFEFRDSVGGNSVNMREDQLKITLNVMNDSTGTTTCVSYVTISESLEGIVVTRGPIINSVQQTNPSSSAYAVPGAEGTNILPVTGGTAYGPLVADSTTNVSVSAYAVKGGDIPISSVKLYWARTDITDGDAGDGSPSAAAFTANETTMTNTSGNLWSGTILASAITPLPARIWYYVVTIDNDGNYDRSPEINEGYYTFDMKPQDPCDVTPSTPASLSVGLLENGYVSVRWPWVTTYTNGAAINKPTDPIVYQVWRRSTVDGDYIKVYEVPDGTADWVTVTGTAPATSSRYQCNTMFSGECIWGDYIDTIANDITYYVVAKNSCTDPAKGISSNSSTYHECNGAGGFTLSVTPATVPANSASSFTVTVSNCSGVGDGSVSLDNVNITTGMGLDTDIVSIAETGDTGTYAYQMKPTNDSATNTSRDWSCPSSADCWGYVLTDPRDTVDPSDTITVSVAGATPASVTVNVALDACYKDPSAPTGLTGVKGPTTGALADRNRYVNLSWTASASVDRAKYKIYRKIGAGGTFEAVAEYVSTASGTITYQHEPGKAELDAYDYYYYVTTVDSCTTATRESVPSNTVGPY